ncbi:MAG: hypothetical protein K0R03_1377 [Moraxellaceae bacterium]|jgi:uncharacterized protein YigA (DUF484 family)|nr:hypothetical protein [Moraxellaceae bacterium]
MSGENFTEVQVASWLRAHKDFFERHPDLLAELAIPHATGGAVSLVERQVGVLRERNLELRERLQRLLDVARENDILFEKIRGLVLTLLEARNIPALATALEDDLRARFNSEFVSLLLFDVDGLTGTAHSVPLQEAQAHVPALVKGRQAVAGQLRAEELTFLFGHEGVQVKSCAVVPLHQGNVLGLLAIGSADADHFRTSMDTLFISFVGDVLARVLTPMLPAKAASQAV